MQVRIELHNFAVAFLENTSIKTLEICWVHFSDASFAAFATSLASAGKIENLCLDFVVLGDNRAEVIAKAFKSNSSLRQLSLEGTAVFEGEVPRQHLIGDEGAQALAKLLRKTVTLEGPSSEKTQNRRCWCFCSS